MSAGIRYSKVSRRMWNDAKFRELSAPPPNAQTLWVRLMTGPELTNIPGVIMAWEAGLAQALGWSLEGFREAFREVSSKGMAKADWEAGLIWVPKACAHNKPESPNVVKSWLPTWDLVPDCDLKVEAYWALRAFCQGLSKAFLEAFAEACPKPSGKPMANQDQDQDQDQEQEQDLLALPRDLHSAGPPDDREGESLVRTPEAKSETRVATRRPGPKSSTAPFEAERARQVAEAEDWERKHGSTGR